jgi:hypothetical protein
MKKLFFIFLCMSIINYIHAKPNKENTTYNFIWLDKANLMKIERKISLNRLLKVKDETQMSDTRKTIDSSNFEVMKITVYDYSKTGKADANPEITNLKPFDKSKLNILFNGKSFRELPCFVKVHKNELLLNEKFIIKAVYVPPNKEQDVVCKYCMFFIRKRNGEKMEVKYNNLKRSIYSIIISENDKKGKAFLASLLFFYVKVRNDFNDLIKRKKVNPVFLIP